MKLFSRITAVLLVVLLLAGCGAKSTPTQSAAQGENPTSATLNGVNLKDFTIVYSQTAPDYCLRAAEYIRDQALSRTGITLPVCEAASGTYAHEIVVGQTDRAISDTLTAETKNMEFAILADDNHIALEGDYFIIAAAAYYFVETYIPGKTFTSAVPKEVTIHQPITEKANNFIFLIGDGMGVNQTLLFEHMEMPEDVEFTDGEDRFYGYYFPYQGMIHTNSLSGITDSAAGATALACGYKTINHYVGKDANGKNLQSLTELADSLGKGTAVMSTDQMNGATPAGFSAHAMDRDDTNTIMEGVQEKMLNGTIIRCGLHSDTSFQDEITGALDELNECENGFFLMYEEGYIDKFSHNWNYEDTYAAMIRFNQAIGLFMEYAFYHPDTFVIITADHETGGLSFDENGNPVYYMEGHSGADVPIFGYGQGAEVFQGYAEENTEVPKVIAALWGVPDFGDQSTN